MDKREIKINIAGRPYPLKVPSDEEATLRKVGKQIEEMIKNFEANFQLRDKQDALAMCALKLGTNAEILRLEGEKNIDAINERVQHLNNILEDFLEK